MQYFFKKYSNLPYLYSLYQKKACYSIFFIFFQKNISHRTHFIFKPTKLTSSLQDLRSFGPSRPAKHLSWPTGQQQYRLAHIYIQSFLKPAADFLSLLVALNNLNCCRWSNILHSRQNKKKRAQLSSFYFPCTSLLSETALLN